MQATTAKTTTQEIEITLNGTSLRTSCLTLAQLIEDQDLSGVRVATAINEEFVPATTRADRRLAAGDRIEIVSARQGG